MHGKFIEGRGLGISPSLFDSQSVSAPVAGDPAHFVQVPGVAYQVMESTGMLHKLSQVNPGSNPVKDHRNFRWLPWIQGKVSYVALDGPDVVSGPFSGCWVSIFRMRGQLWVGHIGTFMGGEDPDTLQAINAWEGAEASGVVTSLKATNPLRDIPKDFKFVGVPEIYVIVTANQEVFTMVMSSPTAMSSGAAPLPVINHMRRPLITQSPTFPPRP